MCRMKLSLTSQVKSRYCEFKDFSKSPDKLVSSGTLHLSVLSIISIARACHPTTVKKEFYIKFYITLLVYKNVITQKLGFPIYRLTFLKQ